ncbi:MAG: DUF4188 domain-containing protein [Actinobacteria bacterium]|nr:DUF4188 domain-containing protein [Actinomycetota bacterium]
MTINRPWRPDLWGFHQARTLMGGRGPTVVQLWRSVEDIYRYASEPERAHRPAWAQFNTRAREHPGAVGIWHETYAVDAGGHESIYHGTTQFGLGAVAGLVPVRQRGESARQRLDPGAQASRSASGTRTWTGLTRDNSSGETA